MGGNAFKMLHCPRIPNEVYAKVKIITTNALQEVFKHVAVPIETPGKADYGDIDFLVSAPLGDSSDLSLTAFPFPPVIEAIKYALNTPHGRRGVLTPDCMYFAIPMPAPSSSSGHQDSKDGDGDSNDEPQSWVQVDVRVCFKPSRFSWMMFELSYASQSRVLGSMVKPFGLTLDPEGLQVRIQEIEGSDWAGSMVWVTRDAWLVCRILGLGRRVVDGGFESREESKSDLPFCEDGLVVMLTGTVYKEYAGSWLFHPELFKAKLEDESHLVQHSHRRYFLKKWIPEHYPDYKFNKEEVEDIQVWTKHTRSAVRDKVFTMFPHVAAQYYNKRAQHLNEVEERKLRVLITSAIPSGTDGWNEDFPPPQIIMRQSATHDDLITLLCQSPSLQHKEPTTPPSPTHRPTNHKNSLSTSPHHDLSTNEPWKTPVYIDPLPRHPPHPCKPSPPPPHTMSAAARLACLARWTSFSPIGTPYLLPSPHAKDFDLQWRHAVEHGASEDVLLSWAREMWWCVWVRQCVVNWRGMWARRFEKEDKRVERLGVRNQEHEGRERVEREVRVKAEELVRSNREKVVRRLERLNRVLGLVGAEK